MSHETLSGRSQRMQRKATESTRGQESRVSAAYVMPSAEMVSPAAHDVPPQPSSGLLVWNLSADGCNNAPSCSPSSYIALGAPAREPNCSAVRCIRQDPTGYGVQVWIDTAPFGRADRWVMAHGESEVG